jgi:transposase-like protein
MSRSANPGKRSQWFDRLQRFTRSKVSVAEFCRSEQVSVASFYQWRRKLTGSSPGLPGLRPPTRASFVPVQVTRAADLQVTFPNGVRLTLPAHDDELVRMSIESLALARTTPGGA